MQVIQQTPTLANHHEQTTAGPVVFLELLKVLGQMVDPLRKQRNLDIGRPCIPFVEFEIANRFRFRFHLFQELSNISLS